MLTTVSPALLPAAAVGGILRMDIVPQLLRREWVFRAALTLMVVISAAVLVTMRRLRHWLLRALARDAKGVPMRPHTLMIVALCLGALAAACWAAADAARATEPTAEAGRAGR